MPGDDDYYQVLGIARNASDDDIKKAYRKAALQWHPDKNPDNKERAEAMFKQVAEAYAVLGDPGKRSMYDAGGKDAVNGNGGGHDFGGFSRGGGGVDAFNLFEQFFGGRDPFAEMDAMFADMHGAQRRGGGQQGGRSPFGRMGSMGGMGGMGSMFGDDPFFNGGGVGAGGHRGTLHVCIAKIWVDTRMVFRWARRGPCELNAELMISVFGRTMKCA
ncbi:unnamed protein product [Prorocentrum cordatum]|uniref:J domain-containing protein n=1 Tax=Prorocentrum cordatum TaxID=2364126 RepID=A0ABN9SEI0_9DINO|nr:unnamed protein product [Polarella glacialis]